MHRVIFYIASTLINLNIRTLEFVFSEVCRVRVRKR